MRFFLIAALALLAATPAWCDVKQISANEVHESANNNMPRAFVEDVVSLLPPQFRKHLDLDVINSSVKFTGNRNKWLNYSTMSEKDLSDIYSRLASKYASHKIGDITLSDELGNTVSTIIEAAMTHGGNDPLGDRFKTNLENFFKDEYKNTHVIRYEGFNDCRIPTCVARIYELSRYSKSSVYPLLVSRTADLWTAIHRARQGELVSDAKTVVRKPMNIAFGEKRPSSPQGTGGGTASPPQMDAAAGGATGDPREPDPPAIIILVPVSR
jgi:hypothetical protein